MNQGLKMDGVKLRQDFGNAVSQTVEGDGGGRKVEGAFY